MNVFSPALRGMNVGRCSPLVAVAVAQVLPMLPGPRIGDPRLPHGRSVPLSFPSFLPQLLASSEQGTAGGTENFVAGGRKRRKPRPTTHFPDTTTRWSAPIPPFLFPARLNSSRALHLQNFQSNPSATSLGPFLSIDFGFFSRPIILSNWSLSPDESRPRPPTTCRHLMWGHAHAITTAVLVRRFPKTALSGEEPAPTVS